MAEKFVNPHRTVNGSGAEGDPLNAIPYPIVTSDFYRLANGTTYLLPEGATSQFGLYATTGGWGIGSYDTGDGSTQMPIIDGSLNNRILNIGNDLADWFVEDVWLRNAGVGVNRRGIFQNVTGDIGSVVTNGRVSRCRISGVRGGSTDAIGIQLRGKGVVIEDNEIFDIGNDAMWLKCQDFYVGFNWTHDTGLDWELYAGGTVHSDALQLFHDCGGGLAEHNVFDMRACTNPGTGVLIYNGLSGGGGAGDFAAGKGIVVRYNQLLGSPASVENSNALYANCPDFVAYGNFIMSARHGIALPTSSLAFGARIFGNVIVVGHGLSGTGITLNQDGIGVYNNTVIGAGKTGVYPGSAFYTGIRHGVAVSVGVSIKNNIVVGFQEGIVRTGSAVVDYNCAWDNGTDYNSSVLNNLQADPMLDSAYRLRAGSPCIGAGQYIPGVRHFGGLRIGSPADIGAMRFLAEREAVVITRSSRTSSLAREQVRSAHLRAMA